MVTRSIPQTLGVPDEPTTVAVEAGEFFDEQHVTLELISEDALELLSPREGVLTTLECPAGATWRSASIVASVNGRPLIGMFLSYPPWRDFVDGTRGQDVESLQSELIRLGYHLEADGTYGNETKLAVRSLFKDLGIDGGRSELHLTDLVRLPDVEVPIADCSLPLGSPVTRETVLGSTPRTVSEVVLVDVPADLVPGERVLAIANREFAVSHTMTITDPDVISELTETPDFVAHVNNSDVPILGRLKLSTPMQVIRVPAGAVIGAGTTEVCVRSEGKPLPVSIVGSSLGSTLIALDDAMASPPTLIDIPSSTASVRC